MTDSNEILKTEVKDLLLQEIWQRHFLKAMKI